MKIDNYYTLEEITELGLTEKELSNVDYHVFQRNGKIYFFEKGEDKFRLFSKISKESFFL